MMWKEISPKVDKLQEGLINEMTSLNNLSSKNDDLPNVTPAFSASQKMLENPSYNVVVCGEVKKGKSSLLNAIIGQSILPVNNEITTSQVFRVTNSTKESFYLVFTDGTKKAISRSDLSRYGSQVDAVWQNEEIFQKHTLSYIQVNVPVTFLPDYVSIVDTPGLGSLYKSHEWITQNYVRNASSVIFVMDPERPLVEKEKEFILKVLDITPHILFVMTKIDLFNEEVWTVVLKRNEELLSQIYAEKKMTPPNIYPVSSKYLMDVSNGKIEQLRDFKLRKSRFNELKEQLLLLCYKTIGLSQTSIALHEIRNHFSKAKAIIENMIKITFEKNTEEKKRIMEEKQEFEENIKKEWSQESANRKKAEKEISKILNSLENRANLLVSPSGQVYREYLNKINSVSNINDVESLSKTLFANFINDIQTQWESMANKAYEDVAWVLKSIHSDIEKVSFSNFEHEEKELKILTPTGNDKLNAFRVGAFIGGTGAAIAATLGLFAVPLLGPILPYGLMAVGGLASYNQLDNSQVEKNKQNLRNNLNDLLTKIREKLIYPLDNKNISIVADFKENLYDSAKRSIEKIIKEQQEEYQLQMDKIESKGRLALEERKKQHDFWQLTKKEWSEEADRINQLITLRNEIETAINKQ